MLEPGIALVSYYLTERDTLAFVLTNNRIHCHQLSLKRKLLEKKVGTLRTLLQEFVPAEKELEDLYNDLVAPLVDNLQQVHSVGLLPHRVLHYLPFAALRTQTGSYWSEKVNLFSSPSASVLRFLLERQSQRLGPLGDLLAVGNPDLSDLTLQLPFAQKEAQTIAIEQESSQVFVNRDATEAVVRQHMGNSELIHLATHGEYNPDSPLMSSLHLVPGAGQDGRLTAIEVFSLPIQAKLVTLSACQTGLGRLKRGDEIIGFNRAFLAAGAGGVLSSLWRVSDVATAMLMKRFYRYRKQHSSLVALAKAQATVRRFFPHPAYWSAFVLTGTWR